jgi:16S rRNA (adenine1518-N6/adenine1519-N6)-dimethyltransferase
VSYSTAEIKQKLIEMGAAPKKSLGQNFLVNEELSEKIARWALASNENLIEVGPGLGALTEKLKGAKNLKLIELDQKFSEFWRSQNISVIEADALNIDWNATVVDGGTTLVSNLPYQISSRIVVDRSIGPISVNKMILMFQKEVAQRMMATPKSEDYGFLTAMAQLHWKVERFCDAGPKDFYPPPQVGSRVLTFTRIPSDFDSNKVLVFLKAAFHQRRKKLTSNLSGLFKKDGVAKALVDLGINPDVRAEDLTPQQLLTLNKKLLLENA